MFLKILQKILGWLGKKIIKKQKPKIVGITGSVGKSSTKQVAGLLLGVDFKVRKNKGNYNNEVGVPLTIIGKESPGKNIFKWFFIFISGFLLALFKNKKYPEVLVLEMAADRPGDIKYLLKIAPCDVGVLTAISPAHTEFFKNINGVIQEKQNIVSNLSSEKWAVLNADDNNVSALREKTRAKVITYGFSEESNLQILEWNIEQEIDNGQLKIKGSSFKIKYQGKVIPIFLEKIISLAQIYSILAGIAISITFEINLLEAIQALKKYQPLPGRMILLKGINKSVILDDTYNSSPKALESALKTCQEINVPINANKWAILGDMLELGDLSKKSHFKAGKMVFKTGFDYLVTVGKEAREIAQGAREEGVSSENIFVFDNCLGIVDFLKPKIGKGDLILIKGSQATRMEKIVKGLMSQPDLAKKYLVRQSHSWLKN